MIKKVYWLCGINLNERVLFDIGRLDATKIDLNCSIYALNSNWINHLMRSYCERLKYTTWWRRGENRSISSIFLLHTYWYFTLRIDRSITGLSLKLQIPTDQILIKSYCMQQFWYRCFKIWRYRDGEASSNFYLDSFLFNHLKWKWSWTFDQEIKPILRVTYFWHWSSIKARIDMRRVIMYIKWNRARHVVINSTVLLELCFRFWPVSLQ